MTVRDRMGQVPAEAGEEDAVARAGAAAGRVALQQGPAANASARSAERKFPTIAVCHATASNALIATFR